MTIIVHCWALRRTICTLLRSVLAQFEVQQAIVVDDGSQDGTWEALQSMLGEVAGLELLLHGQNRWKGAALRTVWDCLL